ncbi:hypothetical protein LSH36_1776g00057, partial [Paralvinella palmiformis]
MTYIKTIFDIYKMDVGGYNQCLFVMLCLWNVKKINSESEEICSSMKFRPECPPNHAILPEVARYGRMNLGRCIKEAYGYLGCQSDVLNLVDRWCSGRQRCQVEVPNLDLDQANANNQG